MARIQVYDTSLRDGTQGEGVNFSAHDKLLITQRLDELGVDYIEGGYPLSNPKDEEYFREVPKLRLRHARVVAFGMTRRKEIAAADDPGMRALIGSGVSVVTLVGKAWELHVRDVLRTSLEENLRMIADSVAYCKAAGREVFFDAEHFFDGFRHNSEYALQTLRSAKAAGASTIILCDTNGGCLPEAIGAGVAAVCRAVDGTIGIHCHNDCDLAIANTLAAVARGARHVQGTVNGMGERCGNADLISIVANLVMKLGHDVLCPGSLARLTELSRYVYEIANMNFRPAQPFVGTSAFAHKGGMHAHGVLRNPASYEHLDPALVGNERRVLLSELAGRSSIMAKASDYLLAQEGGLMARVLDKVQELEHAGYEFEAAEASFDLLVKKAAGLYRPWFERLAYRVSVESVSGQPVTEATVKVRLRDGQVRHTVSDGDGPVNALDGALRKALEGDHPSLREMHLADYKVRVVNARAETAARVRVVIEWRDADGVWGTVGVSENIIEASWQALVDSFEYKLFKDQQRAPEVVVTQ
jgi:2-isopropylmalate synthase